MGGEGVRSIGEGVDLSLPRRRSERTHRTPTGYICTRVAEVGHHLQSSFEQQQFKKEGALRTFHDRSTTLSTRPKRRNIGPPPWIAIDSSDGSTTLRRLLRA